MTIKHDRITITIIPDDYHIRFCGVIGSRQVLNLPDLSYDSKTGATTDYICTYWWEKDGTFVKADIKTIGIRGNYGNDEMAMRLNEVRGQLSGLKAKAIKVKPFQVIHGGQSFGFIPRTEDGITAVDVMPGNCISFIEPFDGEYDT